jgi:hypothetical protein
MKQFEIEFIVKSKVKKQFNLPLFCKIGSKELSIYNILK